MKYLLQVSRGGLDLLPELFQVPHGVLGLLPTCFSCSETVFCSLSSVQVLAGTSRDVSPNSRNPAALSNIVLSKLFPRSYQQITSGCILEVQIMALPEESCPCLLQLSRAVVVVIPPLEKAL